MTIQEHIEALEQALTGSGYEDKDKQHEMRMAVAKQAAMDMDDEEKKEAMKFFEKDEKKEGMSEDEDEREKMGMDDEKELNDGKNGMDEDDEDEDKSGMDMGDNGDKFDKLKKANKEQEEKINSLTAMLTYQQSKPMIDQMLRARKAGGASAAELHKFNKSLYGKSIKQIKARYDEDKSLIASAMKRQTPASATVHELEGIPFNGGVGGLAGSMGANETLEEALG